MSQSTFCPDQAYAQLLEGKATLAQLKAKYMDDDTNTVEDDDFDPDKAYAQLLEGKAELARIKAKYM